jgi:hypothetical protein
MQAHEKIEAIRELIAAYRQADPPDIAHRIYVDIETILAEDRNDPPWLRYDDRGPSVTSRRLT